MYDRPQKQKPNSASKISKLLFQTFQSKTQRIEKSSFRAYCERRETIEQETPKSWFQQISHEI